MNNLEEKEILELSEKMLQVDPNYINNLRKLVYFAHNLKSKYFSVINLMNMYVPKDKINAK